MMFFLTTLLWFFLTTLCVFPDNIVMFFLTTLSCLFLTTTLYLYFLTTSGSTVTTARCPLTAQKCPRLRWPGGPAEHNCVSCILPPMPYAAEILMDFFSNMSFFFQILF